jgi:hypothetical protein
MGVSRSSPLSPPFVPFVLVVVALVALVAAVPLPPLIIARPGGFVMGTHVIAVPAVSAARPGPDVCMRIVTLRPLPRFSLAFSCRTCESSGLPSSTLTCEGLPIFCTWPPNPAARASHSRHDPRCRSAQPLMHYRQVRAINKARSPVTIRYRNRSTSASPVEQLVTSVTRCQHPTYSRGRAISETLFGLSRGRGLVCLLPHNNTTRSLGRSVTRVHLILYIYYPIYLQPPRPLHTIATITFAPKMPTICEPNQPTPLRMQGE